MAHLSQHKLPEKSWHRIWSKLIHAIKSNNSNQNLEAIFTNLLSKPERIMVAKRLMVSILYLSDWTPAQTCLALKLSKPTVYKFRHFLDLNPTYKQIIQTTFKEKIQPPKDSDKPQSQLAEFISDFFSGYHDRSRLQQRSIPKGR